MKRMMKTVFAAALVLTPMSAMAMPVVGDVVGTGADVVKAALEKAGCVVSAFEAEGGMVEVICTETATSSVWDISIDPASGAIAEIKASED
jgi:hypothetical protein